MIQTATTRTILVHFNGAAAPAGAGTNATSTQLVSDRRTIIEFEATAAIRWYSQGPISADARVYALLPERWTSDEVSAPLGFGKERTIWYRNDATLDLPPDIDSGEVWIINGDGGVLIDVARTQGIARRRDCDVVVFAHPDSPHVGYNDESVLVDERGSVLQIRRHYLDSPLEADCCAAPATGLICAPRTARMVAAHILRRGWGLDSIGGLTRRFRLEWIDAQPACANRRYRSLSLRLGSSGPTIDPTLGDSRMASWDIPTSTAQGPDRASVSSTRAPDTRNLRTATSTDASDQLPYTDPPGPWLLARGERNHQALPATNGATPHMELRPGYRIAKRTLDVLASLVAIVTTAPAMLTAALLIKATSRGPVLFAHTRQGLNGREFKCWKFRTMCPDADARQKDLRALNEVNGPQFKITNDPRLSPIGAWLRRYNLDELPQFFNVLAGQMSIVGPRPSPDSENQYCPGWRRARLAVKPGITGLWQVLRRRACKDSDFQEWIYYDLEYVRHCSLWLDWQLLWHTPIAMLCPKRLEAFYQRLRLRGMCTDSTEFSRRASQGQVATGRNARNVS